MTMFMTFIFRSRRTMVMTHAHARAKNQGHRSRGSNVSGNVRTTDAHARIVMPLVRRRSSIENNFSSSNFDGSRWLDARFRQSCAAQLPRERRRTSGWLARQSRVQTCRRANEIDLLARSPLLQCSLSHRHLIVQSSA